MTFAFSRRRFLASTASAGLGLAAAPTVLAQGTPVSRIVVGFAPGGMADAVARMIAAAMSSASHSIVVENKPGASGQLAVETVRLAAPDGNTLLVTPSSILSLVPQLYSKRAFDSFKDLSPVACVCDHSFGLAVAGNSPIKTFADFVAAVKANPSQAAYAQGGGGPGSAMHFLGMTLSREIGVPMTHVAYKGTSLALQDVIGGQVLSTVSPYPTMIEMHKAGRLRILAVSNPTRVSSLPDVPTFAELRLPAMELVEWYGVFTSSKVPAEAIAKWEQRVQQAMKRPEVINTSSKLEIERRPLGAQRLGQMLASDYTRWAKEVKETGLSLDS
ncbi:MAG: hypothetical protein J0H09_12670 [Burkholderiales bacterium]|nr:hypothetical protein [Burkholderiales bacterium]